MLVTKTVSDLYGRDLAGGKIESMELVSDEAVNLTNEKHNPCAQKSPAQKKKTRTPCRRHRRGAGQIPSEG